ncbi:MAG: ABC transporter permease, partial [Chloroflexota bacterium]|nr:ABC transporter permease [Chloroflexota bacterium]
LGVLGPDGVVLSETTAEVLAAEVGDTLTLAYNNRPFQLRVAEIARDSVLAGQLDALVQGAAVDLRGMVVPLARLQEITAQPDALSLIAVSNAGDARAGAERGDAVVSALEGGGALAGQGLGVVPVKQDGVETAEQTGAIFTAFFLVLGLFSIAAGILLIVLIFTMLAAERRPEMGMARAVGARRSQLFQQFVAEGTGYALPAGVVGALLGVGATFLIAAVMRALFGDFFPIEANVTVRSLVVAFCLGVVITFLAIALSSWRISRLNVVAAVRDIPDVSNPTRKLRTLLGGGLLLLAGAGLTLLSQDVRQLAIFTAGMSLMPFGLALILRYFGVPARPVFSVVGLYLLLFWLFPDDTFTRVFGEYSGDVEMLFVSGIFMVLAATILVVNNLGLLLASLSAPVGSFVGGVVGLAAWFALRALDVSGTAGDLLVLVEQVVLGVGAVLLLLGIVGFLLALFPRVSLPAVRTAIAYPGATPARTGMTVAMFSLIVFSLVIIATMSENFSNFFLGDEANAGWDVRADAADANPIADFEGALRAEGVDTDRFAALGTVVAPQGDPQLRLAGGEYRPATINGADAAWLDHTPLTFGQRAEGYADDAAIREALRTRPDVAVIDASAIEGQGDPETFVLEGVEAADETFAPVVVEAEGADGQPRPLTIIGVIDGGMSSLFGLYTNRETFDRLYPDTSGTSYFVAVDDPDQAAEVAREVESALLLNGVQAYSIRDQLEESQGQFRGFLYLIQGFMALGLIVGVAAIGVIASRSVVERRQQIGVLRALGFHRSLVSLSFLIETAFIVLLGLVSGSLLGLALAQILLTSDDFGGVGAEFVVPWPIISVILAATVAVALLMAWVPARQAASIAPAEALRYE